MSIAADLEHGLVGRRSGIVSSLQLVEAIDGDAPLHFAAARIARSHRARGFDGLDCAGCGMTPDEAKTAAMAEAVERYSAGSYQLESLVCRARRDLEGDSIDPMEFAQFSAIQRRGDFAFASVGPHLPIRWIRGSMIDDLAAAGEGNRHDSGKPPVATTCHPEHAHEGPGREIQSPMLRGHVQHDTRVDVQAAPSTTQPRTLVWIPAFACFLPWVATDEPPVAPGISTGLAAGATFADAVDRAICEVVERDAISLTWLKGITPPRISPTLVAEVAGDLLPPADRVEVLDVTSDVGLPVFIAICRGPGPWGLLISTGSACDSNPTRALRRAAMEASLTRVYVRQLVARDPAWKLDAGFVNVQTFAQHARLYSQRPRLAGEALEFLDGGPTVDDLPSIAASPVAALRRAGVRAAVVDLTQPWSAGLDIHVARVLAPGLFPLHAMHTLPFLGHRRLANVAGALPRGRIRHGYELWPYPHPFP